MLKNAITFLTLGFALTASAQYEFSSFTSTGRGGATTFVTDYQAVGINPANLGWRSQYEGKRFAMGYAEMTFSAHSEALTKQELRDNVKGMINGTNEPFTYDQKVQAAKDFTDAGFAINLDMGSLGFSFQNEKFGGIAFRMNDRMQWYSKLGEKASEMLFMGFTSAYFDNLVLSNGDTIANTPNLDQSTIDSVSFGFSNAPKLISDIMTGSSISISWTREFNLSYGRKLFGNDSTFALYAGAGVKYVLGMAIMDIQSSGAGQMTAFSALSPAFGIDYGTASQTNPSTVNQSGALPNAVGDGFGFDLGVNAILFGKLRIGAAFSNFGSITWDGNVYSVKDTLVYDTDSPGLDSYDFASQMGEISGKDGLFQWEGQESRTVTLPTTARFGASMMFGKKLHLGTDIILPLNDEPGNYENAIIGFGGDVIPVPWLRISAGFLTGGNYDFSIPLGITFVGSEGSWEGGIASRDAVTFFTQNGPTLSLSMGFLRWRF